MSFLAAVRGEVKWPEGKLNEEMLEKSNSEFKIEKLPMEISTEWNGERNSERNRYKTTVPRDSIWKEIANRDRNYLKEMYQVEK